MALSVHELAGHNAGLRVIINKLDDLDGQFHRHMQF